MRIQHVSIKNYRSIESLDLPVDDYAAFVGANGSGKSSVLYAINWLVNGGLLDASDVHVVAGESEQVADDGLKTVSVAVTFGDLNRRDRERLEKYGRGETTTIRRSWTVGDAKPKVVGNSQQGPNFITVRSAPTIGAARSAYSALREIHADLGEPEERLPKKEELEKLLTKWEDDPAHVPLLEAIDDDDATNFFGFDGQNRLKQCLRIVLIPAASDIASEVAGSKRGSAVNELIGVLMANAGVEAREAWIAKHADVIEELTVSMRANVQAATGLQADRINERLTNLVSNAELTFNSEVPGWVPSPSPTVSTDISIDGITNDVARQGHGIQRAVMIAMFQSLAPDEKTAERDHAIQDGESESDSAVRLQTAKDELPSLVVCIEEPEIYQHPIRARAFARVLAELSEQPRVQVILATHSPYFVRPEQFQALRRFTLKSGKTAVDHTTLQGVAARVGGARKVVQVERTVNQQLPTTFSEGFFADTVVLVEGDTDKAVLEALAEKIGRPFDAAGISVLDMSGKGNLKVPAAMLQELGIPTYIVADGDALGAQRSYPNDPAAAAKAHNNHEAETGRLLAWLPESTSASHGALPYAFGDGTVVCENYTVWEDDIEDELAKWSSFVAVQQINSHTTRGKDMLAYRTDVNGARLDDLPPSLRHLVNAVHDFRSKI